jgi:uncharacterized protein YegL
MKKWTEIICILDRSGSMSGLESDTIGGFNAFVTQQRAVEGRARLTLVLFDDAIDRVWEHVDVRKAAELDDRLYFPRGTTALFDAVGQTVSEVRGRIRAQHEDERPGQVIVLVVTDGHENASVEYTAARTKQLVTETQNEGWEYVFLGANIDAFSSSQDLAMATGSASRVAKNADGIREAYGKMNRAVTGYRRTGDKGDVDAKLHVQDQI